MKFCGVAPLLDGKKNNKYNEALLCLNIVGWEAKKLGQWSFVKLQYYWMGRKRMNRMKVCGATPLLDGKKKNEYN